MTPKLQCESTRRSQPGEAGKYTSERGESAAEAPKCRHSASGRTEENKPELPDLVAPMYTSQMCISSHKSQAK